MKPLFILMTIVSSFFVTSSRAADEVSPAALKSFNTTFSAAKEAAWTISGTNYKVQFLLNDQTLTAFYNCDGTLLGVTRYISSLHQPMSPSFCHPRAGVVRIPLPRQSMLPH